MSSRLKNGFVVPSVVDKEHFDKQTKEIIYEVIYNLMAFCDGKPMNGYSHGQIQPKLVCDGSEKIFKAILGACKEFLYLHDRELKASVETLDMSDVKMCDTFHDTIRRIFTTEINWGRIVSALCVSKTMALRAIRENRLQLVESIVGWLQNIVIEELQEWILQQGGWARFPEKFSPDHKTKEQEKLGANSWLTLAAAGVGFLVVTSLLGR